MTLPNHQTPCAVLCPCKAILLLGVLFLAGCGDGGRDVPAPDPPPAATPAAASAPAAPTPGESARREKFLNQYRERWDQQHAAGAASAAFHGFQFTDGYEASGIRFAHHAVGDANKFYKAVHYDHGNGVAVADVDGDGHMDLYFTSQLGGNELWRNTGTGQFQNITDAAGVGLKDRVSVAASFADMDNDGDPDLFVTTVKRGNALFENVGGGRFRDITTSAGLAYTGHSSGAVFFDYDNDGLLDLFVTNVGVYTTDMRGPGGYDVGLKDAFTGHTRPERTEPSLLYKNLGQGKFREVSRELNLVHKGWSGDATICDLNEDGYPDLYVLSMQGDDLYYENQKGGGFVEKTAAYFPKTPWGAMGVGFLDYNLDGLMDLILTDMHSDMTDFQIQTSKTSSSPGFERQKSEQWCQVQFTEDYLQGSSNNIFGNAFYQNLGGGRFEEVSDKIGVETFWPWGVSVGDLNADGYEDVFITAGMGFLFRYALNSVLLNDAGQRFIDAEFLLGIEPRAGVRLDKTAFVLECDGADRDHPYCRGQSGRTPVAEALSTRSSAFVDLDGDGDLDLVTNEMNDRPQILFNGLTAARQIRYLKIVLVGRQSNRSGLGAWVTVTAGDKKYRRFVDGKFGYLAQSQQPLYFGLADAAVADQVEVRWPSGKVQHLRSIPANQTLRVQEEP